jgi:NAD(P)H-nitrite reductase large subunit
MLPIPGRKLDGVLANRDIADTHAMIGVAQKYKNAVVIGGGLLGLEAANGLKLRGMNATVVHVMDRWFDLGDAGTRCGRSRRRIRHSRVGSMPSGVI